MRALAVLGIGALRDRGLARDVAALARESGAGSSARAAAAYVLGDIGSEGDRATLLRSPTDPTRCRVRWRFSLSPNAPLPGESGGQGDCSRARRCSLHLGVLQSRVIG